MPGTNSRAVAEMTLGIMLAVLRRISVLDQAIRSKSGWSLPADACDRCGEIGGKTVGLIGNGAIPQLLTPVLHALRARTLYFTRSPVSGAIAEWCSRNIFLRLT